VPLTWPSGGARRRAAARPEHPGQMPTPVGFQNSAVGVVEVHQQVPGVLRGPGSGRMARRPGDHIERSGFARHAPIIQRRISTASESNADRSSED
jgi:hypothetical protein